MQLYRPTGIKELKLIAESGFRRFPPRLSEQPIFYPVLVFDYAAQIARDWNAAVAPFAGFVTAFELDDSYAQTFEVRTVGESHTHLELWVPAEELDRFNDHILDEIKVVAIFYGEGFDGEVDAATGLPVSVKVSTNEDPPNNCGL
ncbi:MAG TPA: ADP-ribosylation/crystallin J1 [Blastocatellia bacterium]|nr:ADP-ribosylation/crystallin J1 [Blastocatellia bacterium]